MRLDVLYFDYDWDLSPVGIKLDKELDTEKLGWVPGDVFKLINVNGRQQLVKIDPLEKFTRGIE